MTVPFGGRCSCGEKEYIPHMCYSCLTKISSSWSTSASSASKTIIPSTLGLSNHHTASCDCWVCMETRKRFESFMRNKHLEERIIEQASSAQDQQPWCISSGRNQLTPSSPWYDEDGVHFPGRPRRAPYRRVAERKCVNYGDGEFSRHLRTSSPSIGIECRMEH